MKLANRVSLIALGAALAMGWAASAEAQTYSKLIVFGDSLSDNGNLPVGAAPPAPYVGGRFSNGPVYTEQLGFTLGHTGFSGSQDWAFGGARTDSQAFPPGMRVQLANYLAGGGTFTPSTLVVAWGGANNIFQALTPASTSADPVGFMQTTAVSASADMGFIINSISAAGAGTILVPNLPQLSQTPQFAGSPAAGLADLAVNTYNATLFGQVAAAAAAHKTTNFVEMDVYNAGHVVLANPGAFGFTNVTQSCFNGVTVCATPSTYFYWDGVHPTTAGHHLLAELASEYITYGTRAAATAAEGEIGMRRRTQSMDASLDRVQGRGWSEGDGGVFVTVDRDDSKVDARGDVSAYSDRATVYRFGVDKAISSSLRVGGMAGYSQNNVTAGATAFSVDSFSADGFVSWRGSNTFLNLVGGVGGDSYKNINRLTAVAPLVNSGATTGRSGGVKAQAGMVFDMGALSVSPRAAIAWAKDTVDGYSEQGLMVRESLKSRSTNATTAEASVRLDAPLGSKVGVFVEAGYRDYLSYSADAVTASLVNNTALPLSTAVTKPDAGQTILSAGIAGTIADRWTLGVSYRNNTGGASHSDVAAVSLRMKF